MARLKQCGRSENLISDMQICSETIANLTHFRPNKKLKFP